MERVKPFWYDGPMTAEPGLRERKKQRTRELIADTARRLFAERGFDAVPVSQIAREAEVSEATVFNYFPTKEDLVFHRMEAFEQELLGAMSDRPEGESIVQAFGRFALNPKIGRTTCRIIQVPTSSAWRLWIFFPGTT